MGGDSNPFGHSITDADITENLGFFDSWEDRYRYIIDLGRELPAMDAALHSEERLVRGCQSQVWIDVTEDAGRLQLAVDSDAFIVKGLLGVLLAAYNNRSPREILAFDVDAYFEELGLMQHLSPTRGNGLRAMVARIRDEAAKYGDRYFRAWNYVNCPRIQSVRGIMLTVPVFSRSGSARRAARASRPRVTASAW
jgi:cysteine desulfuration protein SufE